MNVKIKHTAIGTVPLGNVSHTGANIGVKIKSIYYEFGITDEMQFQSSFSTSDCERNMVLALNNVSFPSHCANHRFATSFAWDHMRKIIVRKYGIVYLFQRMLNKLQFSLKLNSLMLANFEDCLSKNMRNVYFRWRNKRQHCY